MKYFGVELLQYNEYFINTVDTDCLGISSHSVECASMCFPVFKG